MHKGASNLSEPSANGPYAARAAVAQGAGAGSLSRAVGETTVRAKSTPHDKRMWPFAAGGRHRPRGTRWCISYGMAADQQRCRGCHPFPSFPPLNPSLHSSLPPSVSEVV